MRNGSPAWAIRSLRTGIVPGCALEDLSVGLWRMRAEIDGGLNEFQKGRYQKPVFVLGEWGSGKSHSLSYCRMLAGDLALATALVSLNARTVPLNHPQRVYGEIVASVRIGDTAGLRPLLHSVLLSAPLRAKLKHYLTANPDNDLCWPLETLIDSYERADILTPRLEFQWSQLLGEDLGWADYGYKREQALTRLESLCDCLRSVNGCGLILLFDEVETIDQLWNYRSRLVAYSVMARLSRIRSAWAIFAITQRFTRMVALDFGRASGDAEWLLQGLKSGSFKLLETPRLDRGDARRLATAVATLYKEAHPSVGFAASQVESWVDEWARNPGKNPRRLIRLVVNRMDLLRPLEGID